jgi:hypothetical protein
MEENIQDFFKLYIFSFSCYMFYTTGCSLFKEIKKLLKKLNFLSKSGQEFSIKKLSHNEYAIVTGKAEKIYPRYGSYIDKNIIVSESNTTYYEDFFFYLTSGEKCIVQPYPGTRLHNLTLKYLKNNNEENKIWDRITKILFFTKSQTINNGDILHIFGKINKNENDVVREFSNLINIKPKEISGRSINDLIHKIKEKHYTKIFFDGLFFILCGLLMTYHLKFYLFDKIKKMRHTIKHRTRIYCKECNINPCNILCEKCLNLSEYCDVCYMNLQEKINNEEINIADIKCSHCKKTLDYCQKLLNGN